MCFEIFSFVNFVSATFQAAWKAHLYPVLREEEWPLLNGRRTKKLNVSNGLAPLDLMSLFQHARQQSDEELCQNFMILAGLLLFL